MESGNEYNARMLAAALSGIILAEIKYGSFSLQEKLYLADELIKYHTQNPIAITTDFIKEVEEIKTNLKDETTVGIRKSME